MHYQLDACQCRARIARSNASEDSPTGGTKQLWLNCDRSEILVLAFRFMGTMPCFEKDEVEDRTDDKIDSQKTMITIFSGADQYHAIHFFFDAWRSHNLSFCDTILPRLNETWPYFCVKPKSLP
jgi:hypothetical protein